ncbi:MAG TPA: Asp-tRNA(Asn)/Glu-tRNA(Gln) amidotransferase GatCAB subunit C [Mycobacterium sp.]|nr:Asp-tRNA(Asn)/Glu-tRNA(Gln) amidotransferase GatCAB subunit C [Mycobacterium sp.]
MSTISRDEVARLAKLARLALTDEEISGFAGQLDAILGYVGAIQAVDVTGVAATDNPIKNVNVTRPDVVAASLTQAEALAEAPAVVDERFAVPQILGEES